MEISIVRFEILFLKWVIIPVMDLDYQSHGNVDFKKQLNHLDKMTSRLNVTLKEMPESEQITKYQK